MRALGLVLGVGLMASCGGGDTLEPFSPHRLVVFGDEQSLLQAGGIKFSVNFIDPNTNMIDCRGNPIWTQELATSFGMVFPECAGAATQSQGITWARENDQVNDLSAQIDRHLMTDSFGPTDLVTVFIGLHDLLELYGQFPARSHADLVAEAKRRGTALGAQINRIAAADGRVLFVTIQDLGLTPFGISQRVISTERGELLSDLAASFNLSLKVSVENNGRKIGLVALDGLTRDIVSDPVGRFSNVTDAACTSTDLPTCTTATLVPAANGDGSAFLWADGTRLSAGGHHQLSAAAQLRARRNPF